MISRAETTNLSNMPAISEEVLGPNSNVSEDIRALADSDGKWKVSKFENTPPMSTYIVAIANGDFKYLETSVKMPLSGKTVPLRIYSGCRPNCYEGEYQRTDDFLLKLLPRLFTRRSSLSTSRQLLFLSTRQSSTSNTLFLNLTPWSRTTSMQVPTF